MTFEEELLHRLSRGETLQFKQVSQYAGHNRAEETMLRWKVSHGTKEGNDVDLWGGRTFELSI